MHAICSSSSSIAAQRGKGPGVCTHRACPGVDVGCCNKMKINLARPSTGLAAAIGRSRRGVGGVAFSRVPWPSSARAWRTPRLKSSNRSPARSSLAVQQRAAAASRPHETVLQRAGRRSRAGTPPASAPPAPTPPARPLAARRPPPPSPRHPHPRPPGEERPRPPPPPPASHHHRVVSPGRAHRRGGCH